MVYNRTGICTNDRVRLSDSIHIDATNGMPRLVVFAAPQKQIATVWALDMWTTVRALLTTRGNLDIGLDSAMCVLTATANQFGGRAT